ncbi:glutamine and serine-rich protein 1 [Megalops cyprinoides]|uniref:glutamine and serine-rich protein 1 n=1 Tax=Megalops cyprinoides TaxID=118141 RepID=UPI00186489BA|nr:glutamine and serine-rich protein 1 [Megalops cyprinoides]
MMDRNYPTSSFAEQLAPAAQTAAWAYDRSTASMKPSSTYGATHSESELLHRQAYASTHQLPSYATAHHPTGLPGVFDAGLQTANSNTTETSVMNFLSAIESRTTQAGPATASLFPQFRTPSWQTGMNSSAATELFVTGSLPSTGTFPNPAALSTYPHPNSFSTRSFATTSSLALQESTFSSSTNGILSPHDPLLQIKSSQSTVPTALSFDRLNSTVLSTSLPPQSSTYRSAQESAPHLLQPQFSLLPSALGGSQQVPQPYSTSVFTGSVERAHQRECSVIKHHQRPSSTQSIQAQLPGSAQHSLQGYVASGSDVTFQSSPQQPAVPCSAMGDSTQVSNSRPQQKTSQSTLEQTQAYPCSIPSPGFSSSPSTKTKDCSSRHAQQPPEAADSHGGSPDLQSQNYPSPIQKQSSVISSQPQPYTSAQLPILMSVSPSQHYVSSPALPSSISQGYSSSQSEKLPSFYKTLTAFSGQSGNVTSVSQSLIYSSNQQQGLLSVGHSEEYGAQVQGSCQRNPSQSCSSSHSQGLPTVSYSAQSQGLATVSPSQSYASGQSLTLTSESPSFSSSHAQSLPIPSSTQDFILMQPSPGVKTENTLSPQKYLPPVHSPQFSSASHSQALQNNRSSADLKPSYGKRKSDSNVFVISKQEGDEFPIQDLQALQQTPSGQTLAGMQNNIVHVVSKMDNRYNSQSVIRSNMQPEDQIISLALPESKKEERMVSLNHHEQHMASANSQVTTDTKRNSPLTQSSHVNISTDELKQHSLLHTVPVSQPQNHQIQAPGTQQLGQNQVSQQMQYIRLPSAQVLLEPSRDLQMILLQQPLLPTGIDPSKVSTQMQQIPVHYLQMDDQVSSANGSHSQEQIVLPQNSDILKMDMAEPSKPGQHHPAPKDNFSQQHQHDAKHHFALSSICFPESMLLGDERNILSNVDDILAATAAACGVTPQDFVKATSSEGEMPSLASPMDSKGHFQLVDTRHISPSFSCPHPIVANTHTVAMTLNGGQLTMGIHQLPKGGVLQHQALEVSNSLIQQDVTTSSANSRHEMKEGEVRSLQKPRSTSREFEGEKEEASEEETLSNTNGAFNPSGRSASEETTASKNDLQLAGQECDHMGILDSTKLSKGKELAPISGQKAIKTDHAIMEFSSSSFPRKKAKSKGSLKLAGEEENSHPKPVKRTGQNKRQSSKGSDTNSPSTSDGCYDSYQQQERMRQKIREVEEKQPEVKTGFIGSFLDFLKSGPKQQFSSPPIRMPNRSRKSSTSFKRPPCPLPSLPSKQHPLLAPLASLEPDGANRSKRLDEELNKNLETLPSFSSDEDDSVGKNQDLQKSITSALSALDDPAEKKRVAEKNHPAAIVKQEQCHSLPPSVLKTQKQSPAVPAELSSAEQIKDIPSDQLAMQLTSVAIEGLTDEDLSDSGGEGMYRERDEFVVKIEDIECLKMTLTAGCEPPAIWKVQKALLQKFVPELRDGTRVFSATNSYLGYFGDAKTLYRRVYVKFIDTVNKREYVRVCNRKPRCKPMHSMRGSQVKALLSQRAASTVAVIPSTPKPTSSKPPLKAKAKQPKVKAEPPPKKRKKWKEEFSSPSESAQEAVSEDDEFTPPVPFATRFLNTRTMKETFKSYVELLISVALDANVMEALEKESDELLLPHMKRVDGMLTDNRRRLLPKLRVGHLFKSALDSFPELSVVAELTKDGETPTFKVRLSGKAYNKKTMRPSKVSGKLPLEYTVDKEKTQWFSLYHSLQHYKYHTFLMCKDEIASLQTQARDLGQEETVQLCMRDGKWVEGLFDKFGELLTQVQQTCSL